MAGSFVSRRVSEFVGVGVLRPGADVADLARQLQPVRSGLVLHDGPGRRAAELRRPRRRLHGGAVVSASRLCGLPASSRARRERVALLLVSCSRRGLHQARRRRSALRLCRLVSIARVRKSAGCQPRDRRRRLPREAAGLVPGGVPQQDRIDHPDPDAALPVDHPLDAVLVRPALRRAVPSGSRSVGGRARRHAGPPRGTSPRAPAAGGAEEAPRQVGERQGGRTSGRRHSPAGTGQDRAAKARRGRGSAEALARCRRGRRRRCGASRGRVEAHAAVDQATDQHADGADAAVVGCRETAGGEIGGSEARRLRAAAARAARRAAEANRKSTSGS